MAPSLPDDLLSVAIVMVCYSAAASTGDPLGLPRSLQELGSCQIPKLSVLHVSHTCFPVNVLSLKPDEFILFVFQSPTLPGGFRCTFLSRCFYFTMLLSLCFGAESLAVAGY